MTKGHNNPPILVELTPEQADFLVENSDTNIGVGLGFLQGVSRETAEKLVAQIEMFKGIKAAILKARQ